MDYPIFASDVCRSANTSAHQLCALCTKLGCFIVRRIAPRAVDLPDRHAGRLCLLLLLHNVRKVFLLGLPVQNAADLTDLVGGKVGDQRTENGNTAANRRLKEVGNALFACLHKKLVPKVGNDLLV